MCDWQASHGRGSVAVSAGHPETDRTRGVADRPKKKHSAKSPKVQSTNKHKRAKIKVGAGNNDGGGGAAAVQSAPYFDECDAAQRFLQKHGAHEGWILELFVNDTFVPPPLLSN